MKDFFDTLGREVSTDFMYGALLHESAVCQIGIDKESYMRFLVTATYNNSIVATSGSEELINGWNAYTQYYKDFISGATYEALSMAGKDIKKYEA